MTSLGQIAASYDTDKAGNPSYIRDFEQVFEPWRDRELVLLELGVFRGESLKMWRDYFPHARIVGLDMQVAAVDDPSGRISVYQGLQDDVRLLDQIRMETAPDGFDIVIDDCSHVAAPSRTSFWHLLDHHLKPGGIYCIEDWGTGYWEGWPDGRYLRAARISRRGRAFAAVSNAQRSALVQRSPVFSRLMRILSLVASPRRFASHDYGMVGFVKELIDEVGVQDATDPEWGTGEMRAPRFAEVRISPGHVFVFKLDPSAASWTGWAPRYSTEYAQSQIDALAGLQTRTG